MLSACRGDASVVISVRAALLPGCHQQLIITTPAVSSTCYIPRVGNAGVPHTEMPARRVLQDRERYRRHQPRNVKNYNWFCEFRFTQSQTTVSSMVTPIVGETGAGPPPGLVRYLAFSLHCIFLATAQTWRCFTCFTAFPTALWRMQVENWTIEDWKQIFGVESKKNIFLFLANL